MRHDATDIEYVSHAEPRYSGKAIAGFILGIAGYLVPLVPSIFAVVLGHAARRDLRIDHTQKGEGLAVAAVVMGWIGIGIALFGLLMFGVF